MRLTLKPWKRIIVKRQPRVIGRFLADVGDRAEKAFKAGMRSPKHGRYYSRPGGGTYRASRAGEYPARPTGRLYRSVNSRVTATQVVVGTTPFYAKFLRDGTSKMGRRKMSDNALQEAIPEARSALTRWVRWARG